MLAYSNLFADRDLGKLARLTHNTFGQTPSSWLRAYFADDTPASNFAFNQLPLDYHAPASRSVYMRGARDNTALFTLAVDGSARTTEEM